MNETARAVLRTALDGAELALRSQQEYVTRCRDALAEGEESVAALEARVRDLRASLDISDA